MVPVNKLLDKVCLSQRQFERQFKNLTGMTPKMFSSITRFSLSEKYLRLHPNESLFSVALDCGYYDHSHLIREFKRFGGASPQALMSNLYTISPLFPYYLCTPKRCKGYDENNSATINVLRDGNMMKSLVKMGLPMVISMLIMAVYNIADTFWVSHLGTIPIAAVSIVFPLR